MPSSSLNIGLTKLLFSIMATGTEIISPDAREIYPQFLLIQMTSFLFSLMTQSRNLVKKQEIILIQARLLVTA